jgi:hypothetical protein
MTEQLKLDWSTAEVSNGELTVGLSAKPPKEWRDAFERTATLLGAGKWEVTLRPKKGSVQIASVRPGDEERVRQFVEGAVLEANTTVASEHELYESQPADDDEPAPDSDTPERSPDEELTGRFREFADETGSGDDT